MVTTSQSRPIPFTSDDCAAALERPDAEGAEGASALSIIDWPDGTDPYPLAGGLLATDGFLGSPTRPIWPVCFESSATARSAWTSGD
jgi:hypothetical protein